MLLIIPGILLNYIRWDYKIPPIFWEWCMQNLCFVTFSEEVLCRGIIQQYAQQVLKSPKLAIIGSAIIFGVLHVQGGIIYVILSTIAGLIYGWVYAKTRRILPAMFVHFGLNLVHILCFTYSSLAR